MTDKEMELLRLIGESDDPGKAMVVAVDIITRCLAGEDIKSIGDSYGIPAECYL